MRAFGMANFFMDDTYLLFYKIFTIEDASPILHYLSGIVTLFVYLEFQSQLFGGFAHGL